MIGYRYRITYDYIKCLPLEADISRLQREKSIVADIFLRSVGLYTKNDNINNKREKIPVMA
jgi:hypothetical protein